jgi:hypothetical protein
MRDIGHFVNGQTLTGSSGRFGDVFNPNTGEVQARVQLATDVELDAAVQAAAKAQIGWAATNPQRRARVMFEFKRLIERDMNAWPRSCRPSTARSSPTPRATSSAAWKSSSSPAASPTS